MRALICTAFDQPETLLGIIGQLNEKHGRLPEALALGFGEQAHKPDVAGGREIVRLALERGGKRSGLSGEGA